MQNKGSNICIYCGDLKVARLVVRQEGGVVLSMDKVEKILDEAAERIEKENQKYKKQPINGYMVMETKALFSPV